MTSRDEIREEAERIALAAMNICGVAVSQVDAGNWGMDRYEEARSEMTKIVSSALLSMRERTLEEAAKAVDDIPRIEDATARIDIGFALGLVEASKAIRAKKEPG